MKEIKEMKEEECRIFLWDKLNNGFDEIAQLFNAYKLHIEYLNGKRKDEAIEEFLEKQIQVLKSLCDSHLTKVGAHLINTVEEWRKNNQK